MVRAVVREVVRTVVRTVVRAPVVDPRGGLTAGSVTGCPSWALRRPPTSTVDLVRRLCPRAAPRPGGPADRIVAERVGQRRAPARRRPRPSGAPRRTRRPPGLATERSAGSPPAAAPRRPRCPCASGRTAVGPPTRGPGTWCAGVPRRPGRGRRAPGPPRRWGNGRPLADVSGACTCPPRPRRPPTASAASRSAARDAVLRAAARDRVGPRAGPALAAVGRPVDTRPWDGPAALGARRPAPRQPRARGTARTARTATPPPLVDFGDLTAGDPATDLATASLTFDEPPGASAPASPPAPAPAGRPDVGAGARLGPRAAPRCSPLRRRPAPGRARAGRPRRGPRRLTTRRTAMPAGRRAPTRSPPGHGGFAQVTGSIRPGATIRSQGSPRGRAGTCPPVHYGGAMRRLEDRPGPPRRPDPRRVSQASGRVRHRRHTVSDSAGISAEEKPPRSEPPAGQTRRPTRDGGADADGRGGRRRAPTARW